VVSLDLISQRLIPSAMEPRSTIAEIEKKTAGLILHVQTQTPGSTRDLLAESVLKRPKESVRVLVGDIGGGFGQRPVSIRRRHRGVRRDETGTQDSLAWRTAPTNSSAAPMAAI